MSKIIIFKQLLLLSITAILISSNVNAEGTADQIKPEAMKDHETEIISSPLKADENTLKTLE